MNKPVGWRRRGRPKHRYLDDVEEDLRMIAVRAMEKAGLDREEWKNILNQAKAYKGF